MCFAFTYFACFACFALPSIYIQSNLCLGWCGAVWLRLVEGEKGREKERLAGIQNEE